MPQFSQQDLADWTTGRWTRPPAAPVTGVGQDTRTLRPGDLYVAIRGDRHDGHAFLDAARNAGAAAALVDEAFAERASTDLPLLVVPDTRAGLTALAAGHLACLDLIRVGVSGSVGKTTVKELTADVLARRAPTIRNPGNWNNDIGLPLSLLRTEEDHRYGVFELGINHPGEMCGLCACLRPDAAILTEVGPVHIEYFRDQEAIAREKAELFAALVPDAPAVVSRENPWFDVIAAHAAGPVVTTSFDADADYRGFRQPGRGFSVAESASGESYTFAVPLPGDYFLEDALLAVALVRRLGMGWEDIAAAIAAYAPPPLRWTRHLLGQRILVDDSYNANPVSMQAALQAFADEPAPAHWLVLGGMLELGDHAQALHRDLGAQAARGHWAGLIAFGPWGRFIADGARAAGWANAPLHCLSTHAEVVDCLERETRPGDAVLVKASRGEELDRIAREWSRRLNPTPAGAS